MPAPLPVILDVDTGVDDACAILFAARHPGIDLRAVTCVGGNASLADVVRNTLTVLDVLGRPDVPVAAGAGRPLLEDPVDARHVHGQDGMGDLGRPWSIRRPDQRHAIELMRDVLRDAALRGTRVTLIPLAPLTNIALLLRTHPDVAQGIERILFMGGAAASGNATASAEFNVFHDPEAAALSAADPEGPAGLAGELIAFQCERFGSDAATIGDAGAVCAAVDPGGLATVTLPVRVELTGRYTRGRTIVDHRDWEGDLTHDPHGQSDVVVDVALGVDGTRYAALWRTTIRGER